MTAGRIIYVHGRGFGATHSQHWRTGLLTGLERAGYDVSLEELESLTTAISYSAFLDPAVESSPGHDTATTAPGQDAATIAAFQERQERLRSRLGPGLREERLDRGIRQVANSDLVAERIIGQRFRDVRRYVEDISCRERILAHILEQLPGEGPCVVIGHSLGSVIVLDLVRRWPHRLPIDLLLTLGSPAALGPMRRHLEGLSGGLPRGLLGGWINIYDPSDPVTGGSGLQPHFGRDVVDHRVQNGGVKGNHGAERHLDQVAAGVVLGPIVADYLEKDYVAFSIPKDAPSAAALFDAALGSWLRHDLTERQPEGSSRRARRLLASEILRAQASRSLGLDPSIDLKDHIAALEKVVEEHLDEGSLLKLQLQLRSAALFAPFDLEIERDDVFAALMDLTQIIGWDTGRIQKIDRAMQMAAEAQKGQQNRTGALVFGGAAVLVAAAATGGFALAAAPGVAGAAFITSGLAGLGSLAGGGMAAGLFITAGAGAATSLLAKNALGLLSPRQTREEIVKIHAEVLVRRWEGDHAQAGRLVADLRELRTIAQKEARLHACVDEDGPKSEATKDWEHRERILGLAIGELS